MKKTVQRLILDAVTNGLNGEAMTIQMPVIEVVLPQQYAQQGVYHTPSTFAREWRKLVNNAELQNEYKVKIEKTRDNIGRSGLSEWAVRRVA